MRSRVVAAALSTAGLGWNSNTKRPVLSLGGGGEKKRGVEPGRPFLRGGRETPSTSLILLTHLKGKQEETFSRQRSSDILHLALDGIIRPRSCLTPYPPSHSPGLRAD